MNRIIIINNNIKSMDLEKDMLFDDMQSNRNVIRHINTLLYSNTNSDSDTDTDTDTDTNTNTDMKSKSKSILVSESKICISDSDTDTDTDTDNVPPPPMDDDLVIMINKSKPSNWSISNEIGKAWIELFKIFVSSGHEDFVETTINLTLIGEKRRIQLLRIAMKDYLAINNYEEFFKQYDIIDIKYTVMLVKILDFVYRYKFEEYEDHIDEINEIRRLMTFFWQSLNIDILDDMWKRSNFLVYIYSVFPDVLYDKNKLDNRLEINHNIWSWSNRPLNWIIILNNLNLYEQMYKESNITHMICTYPLVEKYGDKNDKYKSNNDTTIYYPIHIPYIFNNLYLAESWINIIFMKRFCFSWNKIDIDNFESEIKMLNNNYQINSPHLIEYHFYQLHDLFVHQVYLKLSDDFINKWKETLITYGMFSVIHAYKDMDKRNRLIEEFKDYWLPHLRKCILSENSYKKDLKIIIPYWIKYFGLIS